MIKVFALPVEKLTEEMKETIKGINLVNHTSRGGQLQIRNILFYAEPKCKDFFVLAKENDEIIGYALIKDVSIYGTKWMLDAAGDITIENVSWDDVIKGMQSYYIAQMAIKIGYQNHGIGSKMISFLYDNYGVLFSNAAKTNQISCSFHERCGMKVVGNGIYSNLYCSDANMLFSLKEKVI